VPVMHGGGTKEAIQGMQSQTILQFDVLEGVCSQLQAQEEKKTKKRKTGKINMDGCMKILTQDDIIAGVQEWQDGQDKVVLRRSIRKKVPQFSGHKST